MATKLTCFVVGPMKSASQTTLADVAESVIVGEYHPTQGVRILECERTIKAQKKYKEATVTVEIWDCSGDPCYLPNWPAVASSASAVIFVCPPEKKSENDLEVWHSMFSFLKESQSVVFANRTLLANSKTTYKLKPQGKSLSKVPIVYTSVEEQETIKKEFDRLLTSVYAVACENREKEEQSLLS
ncbi:hypothetical protein BC829DRAFT_408669 [Chytridium lagenaria]|nr:hypothetical protein BC829DRAFT_408669 [Chytridium lagenaria]